jgi:hypothetical protein
MFRDEARAVAGKRSLAFWSVLLLLSGYLILDSEILSAVEIWAFVVALIGFVALYYRVGKFSRNSSELLVAGETSAPYDHRKQFRTLLLVVLMTPVAFFLPLLLASGLSFGLWLGSTLGVIDGWVLGILLYNLYLLNWQNKNSGKLFVLQRWDGRQITHMGMTFVKNGENN